MQDPTTVVALCDRQFGVGGDGVLAVLPSKTGATRACASSTATAARPRCAATASAASPRTSTTAAGIAKDEIADRDRRRASSRARSTRTAASRAVTVGWARRACSRGEIPMTGPADERCVEQTDRGARPAVRARDHRGVDGQPARDHVGRLARRGVAPRARRVGPAIENHAWFPQRTNAEFAHVKSATRDRSRRVGARLRHHARVRHRRVRHRRSPRS